MKSTASAPGSAVALSEEAALIESFALRVQMVVRQLAAIGPVLAQYDRQIAEVNRRRIQTPRA